MYLPFHWIPWRFNVCTNNIHYTCIHHRCEWMYATYLLIWCPSFYTIINLRSVIMSNLDYATWLQNSNEGGDFIVFYFFARAALAAHLSAALQPSCPPCAKFKTGQGQGRRCNFSSRSTAAYVLYSRYTVLRKFSYPTICDFRFHTLQFVIYSKAWIYTASSCTDLAGARF